MKVKDFFKSTAFKCIVVLLAIVLVCGILLTICHSLFYVSEQEKLDRAIAKIYGDNVTTQTVEFDPDGEVYDVYDAQVLRAYKIEEDGNFLVLSKGKGGYGGSVNCWVVVKVTDGKITGLKSVSVESSQGETQLNNLNDAFYQKFIDGYNSEVVYSPDDGYVVSGTTLSSTAINNAVNGALVFVNKQLGNNVDLTTPYDDYLFTEYIDKQATTHSVDGKVVTYKIVTKGNSPAQPFTITVTVGEGGVISSYTIDVDGSTTQNYSDKVYSNYTGKDAAYFKSIIGEDGNNVTNENYENADIQTGATRSNYLCLYAGLFATANYETALTDGGVSNE